MNLKNNYFIDLNVNVSPYPPDHVSDHVNQMDINAKILKYCKQERSLKEI